MTRRTRAGSGWPATPGTTPAGGPPGWDMPGGIAGSSLFLDLPWASAGEEPMTRGALRAGYGLRRRDIYALEAAGLLSARRTWSTGLRYVATSGRLPERPRRGARQTGPPDGRAYSRPRVWWPGIALAVTRGAGRLILLVLLALGLLLRPVPWWLLLAAAAALCIAVSPHTLLLAAPAGAALLKTVPGVSRAIGSARQQPPPPPPPRQGWW